MQDPFYLRERAWEAEQFVYGAGGKNSQQLRGASGREHVLKAVWNVVRRPGLSVAWGRIRFTSAPVRWGAEDEAAGLNQRLDGLRDAIRLISSAVPVVPSRVPQDRASHVVQ